MFHSSQNSLFPQNDRRTEKVLKYKREKVVLLEVATSKGDYVRMLRITREQACESRAAEM
jgi:hypothetical protein